MPWTEERKQQSRERILQSAARLFSSRGFDNVSIGEIMGDAGLTHGAFYAHFDSKRQLYAEAVLTAAQESAGARLAKMEESGQGLLEALVATYLDPGHVGGEQPPCPLAFLASDVANREDEVRAAYTQVFKRMVAFVNRNLAAEVPSRRNRALALSALMVGGIAVSRALDDETAVESLLEACREFGVELLGMDSGVRGGAPERESA